MRIVAIVCLAVLLTISLLGLFAGVVNYANGGQIKADIWHIMEVANYSGESYLLRYVLYKEGFEELADENEQYLILVQQARKATDAVSERFFWPLAGSAVGLALSVRLLIKMWMPPKKADDRGKEDYC